MKELLEEIKEQLGCHFLSDLHTSNYQKKAIKALELMEMGGYTVQEWEEAEEYIRQDSIDT